MTDFVPITIDSVDIDLVSAAIGSVVADVVPTAIDSMTPTIMHSGVADSLGLGLPVRGDPLDVECAW